LTTPLKKTSPIIIIGMRHTIEFHVEKNLLCDFSINTQLSLREKQEQEEEQKLPQT
jgi:hypothetical protein